MCTKPLKIFHKRDYSFNISVKGENIKVLPPNRRYSLVPCGKCRECREQKRKSYFFRCFQEYLHSGQNRCAFLTATYAPEHLPNYIWSDPTFLEDGSVVADVHQVTYWNKFHVQNFLKKLNERLLYLSASRAGIPRLVTLEGRRRVNPVYKEYALKGRPLSYLAVCERGKSDMYRSASGQIRYGTARPHYHFNLFLNPNYDNLTYTDLEQLSASLWTYGSVYCVAPDRDPSSASIAMYYVCKYVAKMDDVNYKYDLDKLPYFCDHSNVLTSKPFMLLSQGLGLSYLDKFVHNNTFHVEQFLNELNTGIPFSVGGKYFNINMPSYYLDKLRSCHVIRDTFEDEKPTYKPYTELVFDPLVNQPIEFISTKQFDLNKSFTIPSNFSDQINVSILHNRANNILDFRQLILNNPDTFRSIHSKVKHTHFTYDELYSALAHTHPDDLYLYSVQDYGNNDLAHYDQVINQIRCYQNVLVRMKHDAQVITYNQKLSDWIREHPHFLDKKPISTE